MSSVGGAVVAVMMVIPSVLSIALLSCLDKFNFRYDKVSDENLGSSRFRDWTLGLVSTLQSCWSIDLIYSNTLFL